MFGKRFELCKLLGFTVYVDWSWFVILVLITWSLATALFPHYYKDLSQPAYWLMGLSGAVGLFVSIVLHELAHSLVARRHGVRMKGITLFIFGGVAEMSDEPSSPQAEFRVAIAGPIASILIALVAFLFSRLVAAAGLTSPIVGVLWYLGFINSALVVFNLIPAFPLDGGRVLRSLIWHFSGSLERATRITAAIGSGFGTFLVLLGLLSIVGGNFIGGLWQCLIGMFLRSAAQMSYRQVIVRRALEGEPVARFMSADVVTVSPLLKLSELVEEYIYTHQHKMYPVVEDGRILGCVTIRDLKQVPRDKWSTLVVADVYTQSSAANTIAHDADAAEALSKMSRHESSRLMVLDEQQLCGVIALKDLLNFIALKMELEEEDETGGSIIPNA